MPAPVIVVHPNLNTRDLALTTLRNAGLEAAGFEDPLMALDTIAEGRSRILVTAVDFGSGKLNGVALVRRLKRRGIKAVFVASAEESEHAVEQAIILRRPLVPLHRGFDRLTVAWE